MPCEQYKNYLEAYCDDVLPLEAASKVEHHIEACPSCRKTVTDYQSLNILLNSYTEDRVPEERFAVMRSAILERISREDKNLALDRSVPPERSTPTPGSITAGLEQLVAVFTGRLWKTAAVAVTCVVLVLIGIHIGQRPGTNLPEAPERQNLAVDTRPVMQFPVEQTADGAPVPEPVESESDNARPVTQVASQILEELNLMQIEMNSAAEFEQIELYDSIFDGLTNGEISSEDG